MSIWDNGVRKRIAALTPAELEGFLGLQQCLRHREFHPVIEPILHAIHQHGHVECFDLAATICIQSVLEGIFTMHVGFGFFDVGEEPEADACRAENLSVLQRHRRCFESEVFSGCNHEGDGQIWSGEGIEIDFRCWESGEKESRKVRRPFPLEIGSTAGSRTLGHLYQDQCLVRWPYGSRHLVFLSVHPTRPGRFRTDLRQLVMVSPGAVNSTPPVRYGKYLRDLTATTPTPEVHLKPPFRYGEYLREKESVRYRLRGKPVPTPRVTKPKQRKQDSSWMKYRPIIGLPEPEPQPDPEPQSSLDISLYDLIQTFQLVLQKIHDRTQSL